MNDSTDMEMELDLEIVELGDAKEETKGPTGTKIEENQALPYRV